MVFYGRHVMENDCFIQRFDVWMLKLESQSVHVCACERKEWMRDVDLLVIWLE